MRLVDGLTKQEVIVLALVAKGWRNTKIASELSISVKTVETHLTHIFDKLGVSSRTQAALYALHTGLLAEMSRTPDDIQNDRSYS